MALLFAKTSRKGRKTRLTSELKETMQALRILTTFASFRKKS